MAMHGLWFEDTFYFGTADSTRKAKNLVTNPNCIVFNEQLDELPNPYGIGGIANRSWYLARLVGEVGSRASRRAQGVNRGEDVSAEEERQSPIEGAWIGSTQGTECCVVAAEQGSRILDAEVHRNRIAYSLAECVLSLVSSRQIVRRGCRAVPSVGREIVARARWNAGCRRVQEEISVGAAIDKALRIRLPGERGNEIAGIVSRIRHRINGSRPQSIVRLRANTENQGAVDRCQSSVGHRGQLDQHPVIVGCKQRYRIWHLLTDGNVGWNATR